MTRHELLSGKTGHQGQAPNQYETALRLSPLLKAPTGQILEAVRKLGLEGVVGKRIDSSYEPENTHDCH